VGKTAIEEHFAIVEKLSDSHGYFSDRSAWRISETDCLKIGRENARRLFRLGNWIKTRKDHGRGLERITVVARVTPRALRSALRSVSQQWRLATLQA
jgi:hypothetical protein